MDRHRIDAFCARHPLDAAGITAALTLTGQRPDTAAWRAFTATLLRAAGLGAMGAGIVFFVAANWQDWGVLGRFVLLQGGLLACVGAALWQPAPARAGQAALILATLLTGGLLALFGQSYQTGADLYELFFTWALLALPFALAGLSGALWALWWAVLNLGLALLCGWLGLDHSIWRLLDGWRVDRAVLLMWPCVLNLAGAGVVLAVRATRFADAAPLWLARFLAALGFLYGTAATINVVLRPFWHGVGNDGVAQRTLVAFAFIAISAGIAFATWRRRRDVFPMALVAASWIAISTTWIARPLRSGDLGAFFFIAFWLIAASTGAGLLLMHWVRAWHAPTYREPAAP